MNFVGAQFHLQHIINTPGVVIIIHDAFFNHLSMGVLLWPELSDHHLFSDCLSWPVFV